MKKHWTRTPINVRPYDQSEAGNMSATIPHEYSKLAPAIHALQKAESELLSRNPKLEDARELALESTAAALAGIDPHCFWEERDDIQTLGSTLERNGRHIANQLTRCSLSHPSLALATLATPELSMAARRRNGVYYTDSRLAKHLATQLSGHLFSRRIWLDPACGSGILLVAAALEVGGNDPKRRQQVIAERVHGADLASCAVRGARLALASLGTDQSVIESVKKNIRVADSLLGRNETWKDIAPTGFDLILGNPPWEKLKVSRHEFLKAQGFLRHYGADYHSIETAGLSKEKERLAAYIASATSGMRFQGSGEADLYKCFVELALDLLNEHGVLGYIIPAGLIRSKGTEELRRHLLSSCTSVRIDVLENRARFFAIDTRAKFLSVVAERGNGPSKLMISHATGAEDRIDVAGTASFSVRSLRTVRPDLTIPEVKSQKEWKLFQHAFTSGYRLDGAGGSPWHLEIVREVDMTNDRGRFVREPTSPEDLPIVEGRMVHQFHFGAKSYHSGTGRRARWVPQLQPSESIRPQFWIRPSDLSPRIVERSSQLRIGFCDVTGQTNERTMLAAMIPGGVACGNKVPTIQLVGGEADQDRAPWLWLAVANSFVFDWLLRRVVTTSVNFFLMRSMVFPKFGASVASVACLSEKARLISMPQTNTAKSAKGLLMDRARHRASIDVSIAIAFGLSVDDMELLLDDFRLLDRGQPTLNGENRSTITRDLVLLEMCKAVGEQGSRTDRLRERVARATALGAVGYIPSEFAEYCR